MQALTIPRIDLPGLTDLEREAVTALRSELDAAKSLEDHIREQQKRMAAAMVALGKPIFRRGKPKRVARPRARYGDPSLLQRQPLFARLEEKKAALAKARAKGGEAW